MNRIRRVNDAVHMYVGELGARVVAESGRATDHFHLGKLILRALKDAPDFVMQIDGATDESETNRSVLERSIRCAKALKNFGLERGDVMVLMAPNHLDLAIPFYAALYLGVIISPVDRTMTANELHGMFGVNRPKIIFCQSEKAPDIQLALNQLNLKAEVVTFDTEDNLCSFQKFLDKYTDDGLVEDFNAVDFNPGETLALLIHTSGTTGTPKCASVSHKNFAINYPFYWSRCTNFPTPTRLYMMKSTLNWITAIINFIMSPILRFTRLQSSLPMTPDHACYLINKYKPSSTLTTPTSVATLLRFGNKDYCDLTCFESILLIGSAVYRDLVEEIKNVTPNTDVFNVWSMTELAGVGFHVEGSPPGSCGKPLGCLQYRPINVETQKDITEPHTPGELWIKGPGIFKGYYNNEKATQDAFTIAQNSGIPESQHGFKQRRSTVSSFASFTNYIIGEMENGGQVDVVYTDFEKAFDRVDYIILLQKLHVLGMHGLFLRWISPVELEAVIRQHPAVMDVAVTGVEDAEYGDLAVACVVKRSGHSVTAQEIKDLVKKNLKESRQLKGTVIFLNELPITATTKIHRRKLKEMATQMERE